MTDNRDNDGEILAPQSRHTLIGHTEQERFVGDLLAKNALNNGWMITGPDGIGKATLAYRIARAVLSGADLRVANCLSVDPDSKTAHLIANKAHPDLFVVEREWDEKKQRYLTDISVETIRRLISSFGRTTDSGRRVAIIDTADDLNRNSANALLKVLEEPSKGALILLLVNSPGRMLPTIRSRCRVLHLHPVPDAALTLFLSDETNLDSTAIEKLADVADGRPGYGLKLASSQGATAMQLVDGFFTSVAAAKGLSQLADKLAPKAAEDIWHYFRMILLQQIGRAVRSQATSGTDVSHRVFQAAPVHRLLQIWEEIKTLIERGEALNSDRGQLVLTMGIRMRAILNGDP